MLYPAWDQWQDATAAGIDPVQADAAMRRAVLAALTPGYRATFEALALLRALPRAGSDHDRHDADRDTWGRHLQRVEQHTARFRAVLDGLAAAKVLQDSEAHHATYQRQQALDDPLALEELIFSSDALHGQVVAVDATHQLGPRRFAPRITVRSVVPFANAAGTRLYSTVNDRQTAEVVAGTADTVVLQLHGGMGSGRPTPDRLPTLGSTVTFVGLKPAEKRRRTLPRQLPWIHRLPDEQVGA